MSLRPKLFTMGITEICNNNCIFCMEQRKRTAQTYKLEELKKVANEFESVDFSHGEPTTSPELEKYIALAKAAGFKEIGITTNGRMFSIPGYAEKLVRAGMTKFNLSIHGHNARIHDALTRTPGSFEQSIKGLENISNIQKKYNLRIAVSTTVVKQNIEHLPAMAKVFLKHNIQGWILNVFDPIRGRAEKMSKTLFPRYSEVDESLHNVMNKFGQTLKDRSIEVVASMPICTLRDELKTHYSNYEILILKEGSQLKPTQTGRGKEFLETCEDCKANQLCDGVWKKYIELYGDSEFIPLKTTKPLMRNPKYPELLMRSDSNED